MTSPTPRAALLAAALGAVLATSAAVAEDSAPAGVLGLGTAAAVGPTAPSNGSPASPPVEKAMAEEPTDEAAPVPAAPAPPPPKPLTPKQQAADRICTLIANAAASSGLPKPFFARLIWKESRFDVKAVSPVGAQGVAQFMPATAKARGLKDPFDPVQAIPASASLLADLRRGYGSLGLAAAAYNAGESRVSRWLSGKGGLPGETRDYVFSITGKPADWFRERGRDAEVTPLVKDKSFDEACRDMPVIATRASPRPPWGVVVAGGRNRRAAMIAFERARRRAPSLIDGGRLHIVRKSRRAAGPVYTARIGAETRSEARRICLRLARAGFNCYLRRN
ncbi:MAG: lytic transglycosylase domain-containing protein [Pseudomonadota bacterium]